MPFTVSQPLISKWSYRGYNRRASDRIECDKREYAYSCWEFYRLGILYEDSRCPACLPATVHESPRHDVDRRVVSLACRCERAAQPRAGQAWVSCLPDGIPA